MAVFFPWLAGNLHVGNEGVNPVFEIRLLGCNSDIVLPLKSLSDLDPMELWFLLCVHPWSFFVFSGGGT